MDLTDSFIIRNKSNSQNKFRIHSDGQTFLYYNYAEKLKTTNTGIDVTGTLVATTFDGNLTGNVTGNISGGTVAGSTGTFSSDVSIVDKIIHTDDTNTAIRFPADDTVTVETAGSERFRVANAASTFQNKLIIDDGSNGHLFLNNTSTDNTIHSGTTGFAAYKNLVINAAQHVFKISNTEKLRIGSNGKVGVNTTGPSQQFTSYAASGYPILANGPSNGIGLGGNGAIVFGTKDLGSYGPGILDGSTLEFKISGSPKLNINSSGKVLILSLIHI